MQTIRVLLVDDSPEFLATAIGFLSELPEVHVVGQELSGAAALEQVPLTRPDIILMDLEMPGMNGLEATRRLKQQVDPPLIVIVTLHDATRFRVAAAKAGADGFVTKQRLPTELLPLLLGLMAERNRAPCEAHANGHPTC